MFYLHGVFSFIWNLPANIVMSSKATLLFHVLHIFTDIPLAKIEQICSFYISIISFYISCLLLRRAFHLWSADSAKERWTRSLKAELLPFLSFQLTTGIHFRAILIRRFPLKYRSGPIFSLSVRVLRRILLSCLQWDCFTGFNRAFLPTGWLHLTRHWDSCGLCVCRVELISINANLS